MCLSIVLASISQILLKTAAKITNKGFIWDYLNSKVIVAYTILFITTIISVLALRYIPIYVAASMEALSQGSIAILGRVVLKERITKRKRWGIMFIMVGVAIVCI